jgi:ABC-type nitrate/sulfonate/bicarbonate transport system substrate-binding protein
MTDLNNGMTRRQHLALASGGLLAAALGRPSLAAEMATVRQGYQTNIWGMPTYYLMQSGALARHGIKFEDFAVPSGNLTMQQMVARQVDLGTYAGQSFILGADRGDLVAIAAIEQVGKTVRVMGRKDLNLKTVADLKGKKIANQTGSSIATVFADKIAPKAGLKKGDYEEIRMNVDDMVAALAAKTVDAMITVEPYNAIAETDGIATTIVDYWDVDQMPVFMAATPDFVEKNGDTLVAYLKAWLDVGREFKENPDKVADVIYAFYTDKGYTLSKDTFRKALAKMEINPGSPAELKPYLEGEAKGLIEAKKIRAAPDWSKAIRPEFMEKAQGKVG